DNARAAGSHDDSTSDERSEFGRCDILRCDTACTAFIINDSTEEFPSFIFVDETANSITSDLLIKGVQKLLACCRTGECRPVVQRSAETPEIKQPFRCPVEHDTHAVEQMYDFRSCFRHCLDRRLVGKEVTAVNRIIKVNCW